MAVEILYCSVCGHHSRMEALAASLKSKFGEIVIGKRGTLGQYDVFVDGRLAFSRSKTGRFPADGEIEEIVGALKSGREPPSPQARQPRTLASAIRERLRQ
ncbi:MAG: Rdx family protein [Candidatus Binataceae bacterium]